MGEVTEQATSTAPDEPEPVCDVEQPAPIIPSITRRRPSRHSVSMSLAEGLTPNPIANVSSPGPNTHEVLKKCHETNSV